MRLDYERPPRLRHPMWYQVGRWILVSLIAATFLAPFIVSAVAVLARPIIRTLRNL